MANSAPANIASRSCGADADRNERVSGGIIVVEPAPESFTLVHREIELEFVTGAGRRVGPGGIVHHGTAAAIVDRAAPLRLHPRRTIEEMRELFQRDRFLVVEAPGRVTFTQQCRSRRGSLCIAVRGLAQVDLPPGPAGPDGWQRRNDSCVGITSA